MTLRRAMMKKMMLTVVASVIALSACAEEADVTPKEVKPLCEQVVDKIASCLGARVPLDSCSKESAEFILNAECDAVLRYIRGELP